MTETVISSATSEVVIGFDRPFVHHRRAHQPDRAARSSRPRWRPATSRRVERDTLAQVEAGAHMLDVNAGIPLADEPAILAADASSSCSRSPTCRCRSTRSIVAALEAGLAVYKGRPLVNSVTGEEERLEAVLPLVKKYDCRRGRDLQRRDRHLARTRTCASRWRRRSSSAPPDYGIPPEDIVVDPLVMPIGAIDNAGSQAFHLLRRLQEELKVNTHLRRLERQLRPAQPARASTPRSWRWRSAPA